MRIILSEPIVVAMGPESATTGWGPYQFPELVKLKDGRFYDFGVTILKKDWFTAEML